ARSRGLGRLAAPPASLARAAGEEGAVANWGGLLPPACGALPRQHVLGDETRALRAHVDRLHAIGQLAGNAQSRRRERRGINLETGVGMHRALERLAEARGVRARIGDGVMIA